MTLPAPLKLLRDPRLLPVADKLALGKRLQAEDGLLLYTTPDLTGLAALAHAARLRRHGRRTTWVRSRRLSVTNVCITNCPFCAFHASPGDPRAYTLDAESAVRELEGPGNEGIRELHMTAGHHPELRVEHFEAIFRAVAARFPALHLKAFTMAEIDFYARNSGLAPEAFLDRCIAAGLGSCPGGGAEIFDEELRARLCPGKADGATWLRLAGLCHRKGLPTNATMLYGHLEEPRHKVDHLLRLRERQDRSLAEGPTGFLAYIPLAYQPGDNPLSRTHAIPPRTAVQDLREVAVARLLLDNIPTVKAYWVMISPETAQVAQAYGADDLDGTILREEIAHRAGATSPEGLTREQLEHLIRSAGFEPVERDALHRPVLAATVADPVRTGPPAQP